jgi:hypothetical protein
VATLLQDPLIKMQLFTNSDPGERWPCTGRVKENSGKGMKENTLKKNK